MIDRGHLDAAGGYAEGKVLDKLEYMKKGWRGVEEPNASCILKKGHIDESGFLLLTPVGSSKDLEDVDTG